MLSTQLLHQLAEKISNELKGDWLIFGGSSLYLLGVDSRNTIDVDIAPFESSTNHDTLQLMRIAENLNLPIETINQAGSFFLNRIENWQNRCRLFKKGKLGKIYVPEIDLFIELKAQRMSESDLSDCLAYLIWTKSNKTNFSHENLIQILRKSLSKANPEQNARLLLLIKKLNAK